MEVERLLRAVLADVREQRVGAGRFRHAGLAGYFGGANSFPPTWKKHGERALRECAMANSESSRSGSATKVRAVCLSWRKTIYHRLITNLSPKRWPEPKPGGRMRPMKFFLSAASFLARGG
jgi:hypothetical protein